MTLEQCSFTRPAHLTEWSKMLHSAFRHQLHADVTIVCEGKHIRAHRSVLAALSPFLKHILLTADATVEPLIILSPEFEYEPLLDLINFIYHGTVDTSGDLITIGKYAKELTIEGLKLQLLELREAVLVQLDTLTSSDSESDSDDEDLTIVYESSHIKQQLKTERPETPQPGTSQSGTPQRRTSQSETSQPGTPQPGTPQSGTSQSGTSQSRTSQPGTPQPGTPQPGTPQPGTPQSETPQPGILQPQRPPQHNNKRPQPRESTKAPQSKKRTSVPPARTSICPICKETFQSRQELAQHRTESHANILECGICKRVLASRASLKRHLNLHVQQVNLILQPALDPTEN